jgi:hypothetical protein
MTFPRRARICERHWRKGARAAKRAAGDAFWGAAHSQLAQDHQAYANSVRDAEVASRQ